MVSVRSSLPAFPPTPFSNIYRTELWEDNRTAFLSPPTEYLDTFYLLRLALFPSRWLLIFSRWCSLLWGVLLKCAGGGEWFVWEAPLRLVIHQLKLLLSNVVFLPLFIYSRSATELFETYCMKGMTFNPPVASVTPRRKVLSPLSVPFFSHVAHQYNLYCWLTMQCPGTGTLSWAFWFLRFYIKYIFLTGIR